MVEDGTVVLDEEFAVDDRTRVVMFAVRDSSYPGGHHYRFQYYDAEAGETLLRYDNAHDTEVGHHHRHAGERVTGLEFEGLHDHAERFLDEVDQHR